MSLPPLVPKLQPSNLHNCRYNAMKFLVFDVSTGMRGFVHLAGLLANSRSRLSEYLYELVPAAREDIRLSLFVSLLGGVFAGRCGCGLRTAKQFTNFLMPKPATSTGVCATIVSNPADVVVSELKKSKTDMSALQAVDKLRDQFGLPAFARGIELRMIYYSLLVSLQFFLYDAIRISLGVGSDDMRLYLNVLNAALNEN